jgi:hypothetical protein
MTTLTASGRHDMPQSRFSCSPALPAPVQRRRWRHSRSRCRQASPVPSTFPLRVASLSHAAALAARACSMHLQHRRERLRRGAPRAPCASRPCAPYLAVQTLADACRASLATCGQRLMVNTTLSGAAMLRLEAGATGRLVLPPGAAASPPPPPPPGPSQLQQGPGNGHDPDTETHDEVRWECAAGGCAAVHARACQMWHLARVCHGTDARQRPLRTTRHAHSCAGPRPPPPGRMRGWSARCASRPCSWCWQRGCWAAWCRWCSTWVPLAAAAAA